ncbi:unnamed protein product, partial [Polarella glacialis]
AMKFVACNILSEPLPGELSASGLFATILDSAVFHCIGGVSEQRQYVKALTALSRRGGHLIMLTLSDQNPPAGDESVGQEPRRVSKDQLHGFFNEQSGWLVVEIRKCSYCCVRPALRGCPPRRADSAAWLMVAQRL